MDFGTIALIVLVVIILVVVLMSRRGAAPGAGPVETPRYDNPNITSGGSFGGGPSAGIETPRYDNPNVTSGGSFGGGPATGSSPFGTSVGGSSGGGSSPFDTSVGGGSLDEGRQGLRGEAAPPSGGETPRNDNPNIRSGGSFGG